FGRATGCRLPDNQSLVVKPQRSGDGFCCTSRVAIGEHHDQAPKYRITIRIKYAILTSRGFAQGKYGFASGTKPLCKFRGQRQIICSPAGTKIDDHGVDLFRRESAEALVQRLKIGAIE